MDIQKWERDKAKLHPQNQNYVFIQARCSSEFLKINKQLTHKKKKITYKPIYSNRIP